MLCLSSLTVHHFNNYYKNYCNWLLVAGGDIIDTQSTYRYITSVFCIGRVSGENPVRTVT